MVFVLAHNIVMTPIVEATRHLRTVVPQVLATMDITQQEKRELATEVFVHAVVLMHRVINARRCIFLLPHLVVTCATLGCKLVIDDGCNISSYRRVSRIPYLKDVTSLPTELAQLEVDVMQSLEYRMMSHLFQK